MGQEPDPARCNNAPDASHSAPPFLHRLRACSTLPTSGAGLRAFLANVNRSAQTLGRPVVIEFPGLGVNASHDY